MCVVINGLVITGAEYSDKDSMDSLNARESES